MVHLGPFWLEEVHFDPFRSTNCTLAIPDLQVLEASLKCRFCFTSGHHCQHHALADRCEALRFRTGPTLLRLSMLPLPLLVLSFVRLFVSSFVCLLVRLSVVCLFVFVCLSVCLFVCLSVCLFVCLSVCLFVCLSVCLFVCLSVCLFVCLSVCLFVCLSVCLFVCLFVCFFVCSICLSVRFVCLFICSLVRLFDWFVCQCVWSFVRPFVRLLLSLGCCYRHCFSCCRFRCLSQFLLLPMPSATTAVAVVACVPLGIEGTCISVCMLLLKWQMPQTLGVETRKVRPHFK